MVSSLAPLQLSVSLACLRHIYDCNHGDDGQRRKRPLQLLRRRQRFTGNRPFRRRYDSGHICESFQADNLSEVEPDVPSSYSTSDRAPLTGNIQSSSQNPVAQNRGYLNSAIPGEDRRAPQNTIDESVWDTVSRDLFAVWEKMKQVLWPKYLLGGVLSRQEGGDVESQGFGRDLRGLVGRWPAMVDADGILQGGMSEGLRDWDLWGPLIFCLLLSMFLSIRAPEKQTDMVFAGVFSIIWIGESVVTLQIKLLGGNM